jgi:lipid A ethanolaminephosphotransferase
MTAWRAGLWPRDPAEAAAQTAGGWSVEALALAVLALLVAASNLPFWQHALAGRDPAAPATWRFMLGTGLFMLWIHALPLLLLLTRASVRPVLAVLIVCSFVAQDLMRRYGVVLDSTMMRNALRTDGREASELLTAGTLASAAAALVVVALMWRLPLRRLSWRRALARRLLAILGVSVAGAGGLLMVFQDLSSTLRNAKELRYLVTPGNLLYSTGRVLASDLQQGQRPAEPLQPVRLAAHGGKPRLLVVVVGETARAMNFSLNGYARPTNPALAALPVINFPLTQACGSSTEVSLPCMFSSYGRASYDEGRIRASESLVQMLARAGLQVAWLDNQSGCKGVCDGVPFEDLTSGADAALCPDGRCFDGILVEGLKRLVDARRGAAAGDMVVLLHQLGNHGPAYAKRHPREFARFMPECTQAELRDCSREEIVNAYDNALLYTDHLLAELISLLREQQDRYDVGMVYVSDHGESLGEKGLYLHGMPYAIAPAEQLSVPMIWWLGDAQPDRWHGLDEACLRRRAALPPHHDNLFHSLLGLLGVESPRYIAGRDLTAGCRGAHDGG